jgi:hypothetical protein
LTRLKIFGYLIVEKWLLYTIIILGFIPLTLFFIVDISDGYLSQGTRSVPITHPFSIAIISILITSPIIWILILKYGTEELEE